MGTIPLFVCSLGIISVAGRVREQKRVRKLLRLVANSSPINLAVWEECFYRWSALSEFIVQNPLARASSFDDAHLSKQEQLMSLEVLHPFSLLS